jgi:hypothetical protein
MKLDLWKDVLPKIMAGDINWVNSLSNNDAKGVASFIVMRTLSNAKGKDAVYALLATNEVANKNFFYLSKHPKLQLMLLCLCATQSRRFYPGNYKNEKNMIYEFMRKIYPLWKDDEIETFLKLASESEIIELAEDFGMQDDDIKKLKKALK